MKTLVLTVGVPNPNSHASTESSIKKALSRCPDRLNIYYPPSEKEEGEKVFVGTATLSLENGALWADCQFISPTFDARTEKHEVVVQIVGTDVTKASGTVANSLWFEHLILTTKPA